MPRLSVALADGENDNIDYCAQCWDEAIATAEAVRLDFEINVDHPPYEDGWQEYDCAICGMELLDAVDG